MNEIKQILKKKGNLMSKWLYYSDFYPVSDDLLLFIFNTSELTKIIRTMITDSKISKDLIHEAFQRFMIRNIFNSSLKLNMLKLIKERKFIRPAFYTNEIDLRYGLSETFLKLVKNDIENAEFERKQFGKILTPVLSERRTAEDLKFYRELTRLTSDIISEIDLCLIREKTTPTDYIFSGFDDKRGIIKFSGKDIIISSANKETDSVLVLKCLVEASGIEWLHNDEILSKWGYTMEDIKKIPRNKIYNACRKININVAVATKVHDFLEFNTYKARINPKYKIKDSL